MLPDGEDPIGTRGESEPPRVLGVDIPLDSGAVLRIQRGVDPDWRRDARQIQQGLQLVRAMGAERQRLHRSFWISFLMLYSVALILGLAGALWLGQGLTRPLARLARPSVLVSADDRQPDTEESNPRTPRHE